MTGDEYVRVNRASWDDRAAAHAASPDYDVAALASGARRLSDVVAFDVPLLGDIAGLRALHLQCHIGTDTLSLHRLGARVCGLDFSAASLAEARDLARRAEAAIAYVQAEVYDAPRSLRAAGLPATYDVVYTGIGALCWLPSIERWAQTVVDLLEPGGRLFVRDLHPFLFTLADPREDRLLEVRYPYFERRDPVVETEGGTYVETDRAFTANTTHTWNHALGELVTALLNRGMRLTGLTEHDSAPFRPFPDQMEPHPRFPGEYRLSEDPDRVAMTFTLRAVKPG